MEFHNIELAFSFIFSLLFFINFDRNFLLIGTNGAALFSYLLFLTFPNESPLRFFSFFIAVNSSAFLFLFVSSFKWRTTFIYRFKIPYFRYKRIKSLMSLRKGNRPCVKGLKYHDFGFLYLNGAHGISYDPYINDLIRDGLVEYNQKDHLYYFTEKAQSL